MRRSLHALFLLVAFGAACSSEVGLDVRLPGGVRESTLWIEVAAYKDATCEALYPMLANGVPDGYTARTAFLLSEGGPAFGDLPSGSYAFGAVARDKDCGVLALGCREADVGSSDNVVVLMDASEDKTGKCASGTTCQTGRCVPANDNGDPSVGAGCSLELLGAGPLPTPDQRSDTLVSAPAVAATGSGFVIVYRGSDSTGSASRLFIQPIDTSGGSLPALVRQLPEPCADSGETDGVGLSVSGDVGLITLAKSPCSDRPALQMLSFGTSSNDLRRFQVTVSPSTDRVSLGAAKASAFRPQGGLVVFAQAGVGRASTLDPERGIVEPSGTFGGTAVTHTWVAATDQVLALMSAASGTAQVPDGDGGTIPDPDGNTVAEIRLSLLPAGTPIESLTASSTTGAVEPFEGKFASLAAVAGRVLVVSDGTSPGSVSYRAFDLNKRESSDSGDFGVEGENVVTHADVAIVGNRAFVASLKAGGVALNAFDNATTTLTALRGVSFARESRISAINTVRDGRVAVAATDRRVVVVWTTATKLLSNDAVGGYAVFACTP